MKIGGAANNQWLATKNASLEPQLFWGYEDIGAFLLLPVFLGLILRLLVRLDFLSRFAIINPSTGLQSAVVALLGAGLYFILRLRYRQPVLKPLRNQVPPTIPISELLILGLVFGPILEESLFRGCLLPVLAQNTGTMPAVVITAVVFAIFHGPTNLEHCFAFTATGIAYGWVRMASRSTTAPAVMHAAYNLTLGLLA